MTKLKKESRHWLYVFHKKKRQQQLTLQNVQQQCANVTHAVQLHRRDMSTVLLHCSITAMMCTH